MVNIVFALAITGATLAQAHPPGYTPGKMALDVDVECVSLLGKDLYRTPAEGEALDRLEKQLAEADQHVQAQPDNPATHLARGQALAALWRYRDATQAYTRAIALNPADAAGYVKRGETFLVLRLFQQAKTDFEHAAALDPANAGAWRGIGLANYFSYDFKSAHEAFVKAGEAFAISGRAQTDSRNAAEIAAWDELATGRIDPPPIAFSVGSGYPVTDGQQEFAAYIEGWNRRRDTEAALPVWRRVADSKNWPLLWVIAAEAEIAAVEGPKKVIPAV